MGLDPWKIAVNTDGSVELVGGGGWVPQVKVSFSVCGVVVGGGRVCH